MEIINGDCIEEMRKLPEAAVSLLVTSPPYNMGRQFGYWYDDRKSRVDYQRWAVQWLAEAYRVLSSDGVLCLNVGDYRSCGFPLSELYLEACRCVGFKLFRPVAWVKYDEYDFILLFFKENARRLENAGLRGVWRMKPEFNNPAHPAAFPVELPIRCINLFTVPNETVLDCFMGSGTTALACVQMARKCIGIEADPKYCEITKRRIAKYQTRIAPIAA